LSPFLLYIFSQAPLSSFAANFIAIPSITFIILPLALISLFSVMILPALFSFIPLFLLTITAQLLDLLLILLASLSNHATVWQQFSPTLWAVIAAMIGGLILFLPKGFPARWLGLFWILPLFFPTFERPKYGEVKLTLLDVGQGLATVIETQNHTLVYDVGDSFAGQHVVAPYLNAHGIQHINTLIISHDDNDHAGGLYALKERMKIDTILSSQPYQNMQKCIAGQTWQWDNVQFEFLHPDKNYQDSRDNNMSCVLKIDNGKNSILLTGDIHQKIERRLSQHEKIDSDILVIPHHGSRTSSSLNFIQAVTPQLALFSAGYQNHFNHPHPTIQQRYRQQGIPTLNTAQVGAIQILLTQTGIKPARFAREVERHYWHD